MQIKVLHEAGYPEAMLGLSLSYNRTVSDMPTVMAKLASKNGGHNKFLESIVVWIDMSMPRHFWQQFDTYRVGMTKQSQSTMHTALSKPLQQSDFVFPIWDTTLDHLNEIIATGMFDTLKNELPEGFLQRRIVCTNYKTLRNIIAQRINHRNVGWQEFCQAMLEQLEHRELVEDLYA